MSLKLFCKSLLSLLLVCTLLPGVVYAQGKISGLVQTQDAKPIANASVLLLRSADSSLVKGLTSNNAGAFAFDKVEQGNYLLVCSFTGYADQYIPAFDINDQPVDLGNISLALLSKELNEVTVTAKKPLFEQRIDRMVINVKNSLTSAGGTVLDVLEKSPGVMVNRSSNSVSMNGKDGVMVMINGKISYMPQDALIQMLQGINASNVEKVELITTPPAKYDAGGNAGFINIVLLANPDEGFNGSYALSAGYSSDWVLSANTNFNYRKKNINLYGSYSYSRDEQLQEWHNHRSVLYQGDTYTNDILSTRVPYQRNHNARLGLDYNAGKKTVIGFLVGGYDNKWGMEAVNNTIYTINKQPDTSIIIHNQEINHWKNAMGNINIQHNVKEGEVLSVNADYIYYKNNNPTNYQNSYYNKNGDFLYTENTSSAKETIIKIFATALDYSYKLNNKVGLEMGAKLAMSKFTNDVLVKEQQGNDWVIDPRFTANYFLKENIYAGYASADVKLGEKTNMKAGFRYEYTTSNLGTALGKIIVDRKYGRLFPTLFVSHKFNDIHSFNVSYNRRINRPGFTQLAPFIIFLDPKTFVTGNPALQPSITDAFKIDYGLKKIIFSLGYSYEAGSIADFQSQVDSTNNSEIQTSLNLDNSKVVYFSVSLPMKIMPWWTVQLNGAANWQKIKATLYSEPRILSQFYVTTSGSQSFSLPKQFAIEISGFFQSGGFWGGYSLKPLGSLDIAVQKKFHKLSASLTAGVDNLLNSLDYNLSQNIPALHLESSGAWIYTQQLFKLTWTQNFGNNVLKARRDRTTASEDERKRVK